MLSSFRSIRRTPAGHSVGTPSYGTPLFLERQVLATHEENFGTHSEPRSTEDITRDRLAQPRVSFVVEWANTTYNGVPRFFGFLERLIRQWDEVSSGRFPDNLPTGSAAFLRKLRPLPEFLLVSGEAIPEEIETRIRDRCQGSVEFKVRVLPGLEYYALKNLGGDVAEGDILCFLDSDVYPDEGWLAHLLGSFHREDLVAVAGQPYVAPVDLMSRAFALGWTYDLADYSGRMCPVEKFYANNLAMRAGTFRRTRFIELDKRTRGAASALNLQLRSMGHSVWQNSSARVDHPAPTGIRHLAIRALAHGRDCYMKDGESRSIAGLKRSQAIAAERLRRGFSRTFHHWRRVDLKAVEIPAVLGIIGLYYGLWSFGGILTHLSPNGIGSRFRL